MKPRRDDPYWLVRFVALAAAEGVVAGWALMLVLLRLDVGGIGTLTHGSPDGGLAVAVLAGLFGITFGMAGIAVRVMLDLPRLMDGDD